FNHHRNGLIEFLQHVCLGWSRSLGKFQWTIAHVARTRNLRADVVIQVTCEMQREVAKAVAEREGLSPKLVVAQRRREFVNHGGELLVTGRQARRYRRLQICHKPLLPSLHPPPDGRGRPSLRVSRLVAL